MELPILIQKCLAYGIQIYPFQLNSILEQYESKKIPDDVLKHFDKNHLKEYLKGLDYCSMGDSRYWVKGHNILKSMGFEEKERTEGHRKFISLFYKNN